MRTTITEMFNIEYPIICGAMMWLCEPGLCAAISNAGGMGNLTAGNYDTEGAFRKAIHQTREMTDKPFMVNITLLPSIRLTSDHYRMYVRVIAEEKIAGVEVSGAPLDQGLGMDAVETLKKAGVKMFHKVGSVQHAVHAEKVGYDGVYAAGWEEGGHPLNEDVTTMLLTPRIVDSVRIPVVTVGGIADGRSMVAALTLGASGVMMASRFIATLECRVHEDIKTKLVESRENDTTIFGKSYGLQGRALKNRIIEKIITMESQGVAVEEVIPLMGGDRIRDAWETGNVESAPLMVGQSVGLIQDVPTCRQLLETMAREAAETLRMTGEQFRND